MVDLAESRKERNAVKSRDVSTGQQPRGPNGPERSGGPLGPKTLLTASDPEVSAKAVRRRFSAKYKLEILQKTDELKDSGQIGRLLRQEGLYSSHLAKWRMQREQNLLEGLKPKKRGRKAMENNPAEQELRKVKRENERLRRKLEQAETIIDIQKKVSTLLGIPLEVPESDEND
jgi:transposase-like protein